MVPSVFLKFVVTLTVFAFILVGTPSLSVAAFVPTAQRSMAPPSTTHLPAFLFGGNPQDKNKGGKKNKKKNDTKASKKKTPPKKESSPSKVGETIGSLGKLFDRPRFDWVNNQPVDPETDPISKAQMDWSRRK